MRLPPDEKTLFFKLWFALLRSVNERHPVIPRFPALIYGKITVPLEDLIKLRNAVWNNRRWIDEFLAGHDNGLAGRERDIVSGWRKYAINDEFILYKHLPRYSVLMSCGENPAPYGVHGLSESIEEALSARPPFPIGMALLPFMGRIVYDGLVTMPDVAFGPGMRASLKAGYDEAKARFGIIETLDGQPPKPKPPPEKPKRGNRKSAPPVATASHRARVNAPGAMMARHNEIADAISLFCDAKLNAEFKQIMLRAVEKLCRKRPSPLRKGRARTWACGIAYAIGQNNFIFDKSQPYFMPASAISDWFGLSKSTAGNKAAEISKLLGLSYMDTEFCLQSITDQHPVLRLVNMSP
jgi:hypothetical protein